MIYLSDMHINDFELRKELKALLQTKTRNKIVKEIKARTGTFHQFQIDNFLQAKDVSLSTAIKLDEYVLREQCK